MKLLVAEMYTKIPIGSSELKVIIQTSYNPNDLKVFKYVHFFIAYFIIFWNY